MAMGKRDQSQQETFWIPTAELPRSPGHPFYERLNHILEKSGFDSFVESRCRKFYAETMGRPSLAPAVYFRLLLIGYDVNADDDIDDAGDDLVVNETFASKNVTISHDHAGNVVVRYVYSPYGEVTFFAETSPGDRANSRDTSCRAEPKHTPHAGGEIASGYEASLIVRVSRSSRRRLVSMPPGAENPPRL